MKVLWPNFFFSIRSLFWVRTKNLQLWSRLICLPQVRIQRQENFRLRKTPLMHPPRTPFASNNPRALITSVMFTGENYNEWSSELVNALRAKRRVYWWFNTETCHRWSSLRALVFCQFNDCWMDSFFYRNSCSFNSYIYIRFSQVVGGFKVRFLSGKQSMYP